MKKLRRLLALSLSIVLSLSLLGGGAEAKTIPTARTVGTVLFYITNSSGEQVLASRISVSEMEADMQAGRIDDTNHKLFAAGPLCHNPASGGAGLHGARIFTYARTNPRWRTSGR
jgi:hypothetical protein